MLLSDINAGLSVNSGSENVIVGYESGKNVRDGEGNVFMGYYAGRFTVGGSNNVFMGHEISDTDKHQAPYSSGNSNVGIGHRTL